MGRRPHLTKEEKAKIDALHSQNHASRSIATAVKRCKSTVNEYLARKSNGITKKKAVPKPLLSERDKRLVVSDARKGRKTAREVWELWANRVSLRTVQRVLNEAEHLDFRYLKVRPKLGPGHRKMLLKFADEHHWAEPTFWKRIIFTDKKSFCLDGPDGSACFWSDKRLPPDIFSKRARGGGGLMVWAAISWRRKISLVVVDGNLNANRYVNMLSEHFLPFRDELYPAGCLFLQDSAPAHSAKFTSDFFMEESITDLGWAPKSPDLNVIENTWGELTRRLYARGRQFDTTQDLHEALLYEWEKLEIDYIRKL